MSDDHKNEKGTEPERATKPLDASVSNDSEKQAAKVDETADGIAVLQYVKPKW